mgnify:CR=1 FL=1
MTLREHRLISGVLEVSQEQLFVDLSDVETEKGVQDFETSRWELLGPALLQIKRWMQHLLRKRLFKERIICPCVVQVYVVPEVARDLMNDDETNILFKGQGTTTLIPPPTLNPAVVRQILTKKKS